MNRREGFFAIAGLAAVTVAGAVLGNIYRKAAGQELLQTAAAVASRGQTQITLDRQETVIRGTGAAVEDDRIVIRKGGSYMIEGSLEGQICVEAGSEDTVVLELAGAELFNETEPALYVGNAGQTILVLKDGTQNRIQSGAGKETGEAEPEEEASMGAVYARDDLAVTGDGSLTVLGYLNNGIHTTNDLVIENGDIHVEAVNNGIKGKDSVTITGGDISVISGGDGIKSDDDTGSGFGVVAVTGGTIFVESQGDGIQAETALEIADGEIHVDAGGGIR